MTDEATTAAPAGTGETATPEQALAAAEAAVQAAEQAIADEKAAPIPTPAPPRPWVSI